MSHTQEELVCRAHQQGRWPFPPSSPDTEMSPRRFSSPSSVGITKEMRLSWPLRCVWGKEWLRVTGTEGNEGQNVTDMLESLALLL